jgi:hypothetical protein
MIVEVVALYGTDFPLMLILCSVTERISYGAGASGFSLLVWFPDPAVFSFGLSCAMF